MREIKFRAWTGATMEYNIVVGKFGAFYVNPGAKGDGLDDKDSACLTPFNTIYPPTTPVMQYSGLKDKNGKEIYEGDICNLGRGENVRKWVIRNFIDSYHLKRIMREENDEAGIIGNIYENPDLLK